MEKSQIKSGAVFSYLSIFTNIVVGLLIAPVMLKYLGDTECSLYNLIGALVGYISVLDFGISNAIIRYVAKYRLEKKEQEQQHFLGMAFVLYSFFAALVIAVGLIVSPFLPKALSSSAYTAADVQKALLMFRILIANLAFSLLANAFPAIMNGYGRFSFQKIVTWLRTIVRIVLLVVLLIVGFDSVAIVVLDTMLNIATAIIFALYVFKGLGVRISFGKMDFAMMHEITRYSFYIFLDMLINQIYWKLGQLVLGVVSASPIEINAFAYGMTIPNYYIMISTALATMFLPTITKIVTEQDSEKKLTNLTVRVGRIQLLILGLVLVGFLAIGRDFISVWLGERYMAAYYVASSVLIATTIPCIQNIGIVILQVKNQMRFRVFSYLGVCIGNVILSFILSPHFGAIGAAFGTVLSLIVGNILIINLYYHKKIGLDMPCIYRETFKGILPVIIISLGGALIINAFIALSGWIGLLVKGIVVCTLYFAAAWFIGMNCYEKNLVIFPIKRLLMKTKEIK
ncbi:oligosaccharide flippase family protein [Bittarella massiliensis (ex Durand et al. 2017)]|uniref:Oligosaccharide flippase family protein n=1 Tax=Bittarella massiliensis (ex Durand et al. 2017) TaxID=1720313 RepID=A0AAW5K8L2_9FIRM|nr:oligosaccharide flippase family protein [Bittarella massiliensis (ex Durand et al. 2017)]MCQ4948357.1 oligosaccharide flippase family protein [Bittarella massiliensis (ex Durand et al. 2017)]